MKLFSTHNTKIEKSDKSGKGYLTKILHLAPHNLSGYDVCSLSTPGCRATCLNTAGCGVFSTVQKCRINKTKFLFESPSAFYCRLCDEIENARKLAKKKGLELAVRLNGTSDIAWEKFYGLFENFPDVIFYDYTKDAFRVCNRDKPKNYYLLYSRTENDDPKFIKKLLKMGVNVAVVYSTKKNEALPKKDFGVNVIDGDLDDLRFLDPKGVIVGLRAKGKARKDKSGFVKQVSPLRVICG